MVAVNMPSPDCRFPNARPDHFPDCRTKGLPDLLFVRTHLSRFVPEDRCTKS